MITCFAIAACLLAPGSPGARLARPPVSLVASPAHVALAGRARQVVTVTSSGNRPVLVEVGRAGYGLDLRGRPRVLSGRPSWVSVRPRRLVLEPGESKTLVVVSTPPRRARPGDHSEVVLLTTRPIRSASLSVRMRLGLVVVVRVGGRIMRGLLPVRMRVRARLGRIELWLRNRGNVTELVDRACLTLGVGRSGRPLLHLRPAARTLLPGTRGIVEFRYRVRLRGKAVARVERRRRCPGLRGRSFAVRL